MAAVFVPVIWTAAEGFHHYRMARQRLKLGLCDPLVCNRYLLWGLTGIVWFLIDTLVIVSDTANELTGVWPANLDAVMAASELGSIALVWLVFFPPRFFQRWIGDSAGTARAEEG